MPWKIVVILGFILLALVIFLFKKKYIKDDRPNYRVLFIVGITWLPLGIVLKNPGFLVGGLILTIIGLIKRDQWRDEKKWSELSPAEKKFKLALIVLLALMVVAGVVAFRIYNN